MIGDGTVPPEQFARRFTPAIAGAGPITTAKTVAGQLADEFAGLDREHCLVVGLDTAHHPLGFAVVSIGSVAHTFMSPREIYRDAIAMGASKIIVAHNHPSGDLTPSETDIATTTKLAQTGDIIDLPLLDHLVMDGHGDYVSMAAEGMIHHEPHQLSTVHLLGDLPTHVPIATAAATTTTTAVAQAAGRLRP